MRYFIHNILFLTIVCCFSFTKTYSQSNAALALEQQVYTHNTNGEHEKAQSLIYDFLNKPSISSDDAYWGYLYLSHTYKWLDDYKSCSQFLDSALREGLKSLKKEFYISNILYEKTLLLFDKSKFEETKKLLKIISEPKNYAYFNEDQKAKILIQEGYLLFLDKKYKEADRKYDEAIQKTEISKPCDLPLIYTKKIELFGVTRNKKQLYKTYHLSIAKAQSCNITKYIVYTEYMMTGALEQMGLYKEAIYYHKKRNSILGNYTRSNAEHLKKLAELDKKYQTEIKNKQLAITHAQLKEKTFYIYFLLSLLMSGILVVGISFILFSYRKKKKEALLQVNFSHNLIQSIEVERERIARELHDGISHELLSLKRNLEPATMESARKIDSIINDIRMISRDLHPAMLDKIGLKYSIEALCETYIEKSNLYVAHQINYDKELNKEDELHLYRIIQEALNNVEKHANAHAAKVSIDLNNKKLIASIEDNGIGFSVQEKTEHKESFGLQSIIERCKKIGGTATINSSEKGTIVYLEITLKDENNYHSR